MKTNFASDLHRSAAVLCYYSVHTTQCKQYTVKVLSFVVTRETEVNYNATQRNKLEISDWKAADETWGSLLGAVASRGLCHAGSAKAARQLNNDPDPQTRPSLGKANFIIL